ncbi:MAG TPA: GNVR domain-containing protein [Acidobacteriota bacterium]|nr:GNVR domain-containing protein [Acidobacteriota bacterium]
MRTTTLHRPRPESAIRSRIRPLRDLPETPPAAQWDFAAGLGFVWKWRTPVIAFVVAVTALTALYSWRTPNRYTASATLFINSSSNQQSALAALGPRVTMALGSPDLQSDRAIYPALLRSRSVIEPLLTAPLPTRSSPPRDDVTLAAIFGTGDPERGCDAVRGITEVTHDRLSGISHVAVTLEDPVTAAAVCNALVRAMTLRSIGIRTADAQKVRRFVDDRLAEVKAELTQAERRLQEFRNRNRNYNQTSDPDLLLADERLARDVALKSNLFLQLFQEYESARIEEKRDIASVQVLDSAYVPTTKSGPRRIRTTAMAAVASGPFAVALLLAFHFVMGTVRPDDETHPHERRIDA